VTSHARATEENQKAIDDEFYGRIHYTVMMHNEFSGAIHDDGVEGRETRNTVIPTKIPTNTVVPVCVGLIKNAIKLGCDKGWLSSTKVWSEKKKGGGGGEVWGKLQRQ
jgi:hypothetical protein